MEILRTLCVFSFRSIFILIFQNNRLSLYKWDADIILTAEIPASQNPYGRNSESPKSRQHRIPTRLKSRQPRIPTRSKSLHGWNPDKSKSRKGQNPDTVEISTGQKSDMAEIPTGQSPCYMNWIEEIYFCL